MADFNETTITQVETNRERIKVLEGKIDDCEAKIEAKYELVETADPPRDLIPQEQGTITRWKNCIADYKEEIDKRQASIDKLLTTKPVVVERTHDDSISNQGGRCTSPKWKRLIQDCNQQPTLEPELDVSLFIRNMGMLYTSHVDGVDDINEAEFIKQIEMKLCPSYRIEFQSKTKVTAIETWSAMKDFLLTTFKSNTTIFQELEGLSSLNFTSGETIRNFAARIKS